MKYIQLLVILYSANALSFDQVLLKLRKEKPFVECDITSSNASIVKSSQGIKYKKDIPYEIDDLSYLIDDASQENDLSNLSSEYFAFNAKKKEFFQLSQESSEGLKLINLISTLCELRSR